MSALLDVNDTPFEYPATAYAAGITSLPECPEAEGAIDCDVCVIGGGFTGLSAALHLAQRGYDVRLLEAQRIGFGASGRNGGQVGRGQRLDQLELEALVGQTLARTLWDFGEQAVELVRALAASENVHADFHEGLLYTDHKARYSAYSQRLVDTLRERYGCNDVAYLDRDAVRERVGSPGYHSGVLFNRAGHIDPLQLALGIARMAQSAGAHVHERSRVTRITTGTRPGVRTDKATISSDYLVLACNGYIGDLHPDVTRRVMPINNYIASTAPMSPDMQESIIRGNLAVADSRFVVNYFRFSDDHRLLFGGSESYGYRFPRDIEAKVRKPLIRVFPQLADVDIDHAWGGTLGITMKRLPHYACYGGNVFSLSGFSGHGVAMGTLSGQIAAETIAGQAERFDIMAQVPTPRFPGGLAMRHPLLVLGMLWYSLRDRLP